MSATAPRSPAHPDPWLARRWISPVVVALLLAAVTIAVYWPVLRHEFINYDDPAYVTENPRVQAGLTQADLVWAFTQLHGDRTYWHPVTWLSHMLDCQLFGLNAGAHHLVNVLLHAANVVLLFGMLRWLTGATGCSTVVAALFALHPLQVDTVAWVAERKNLLSTLFFLLTVWAYGCYAQKSEVGDQRSDVGRQTPEAGSQKSEIGPLTSDLRSWTCGYYWLAVLWFALGLMSKPAVVMLPFVLLLLDYWPLQRLQRSTVRKLLLEKVPFLVLAAAVSAVTIVAHQQLGSLASMTQMPLTGRLANALVSYARYLKKVFWPQDLAVFYPYPAAWPMEVLVPAAVILLGVSALVAWRSRSQPYLVVGWCWFVGTLVPTIGLISAGAQCMADRFVYVPLVGLGLMLVWGGGQPAGERGLPPGDFEGAGGGVVGRVWGGHAAATPLLAEQCCTLHPCAGRDGRELRGSRLPGGRAVPPGAGVRGDRPFREGPRNPARLRRNPYQLRGGATPARTTGRGHDSFPKGLGNPAQLRRGSQ